MRVRIDITRSGNAWTVTYPGLLPARPSFSVNLVQAGTMVLPKTAGFDPTLHDNADLADGVIRLKTPREGDVAKFGTYLFEVLLGPIWADVGNLPPADALSAVELSSADPDFHRLPWEMARSPKGFLAAASVAFVRVVPSAEAARTLTVAPRVLFAIGSDLQDKRVKPGAEYLGLLRRLEATGLNLETQLLVRATRKSIEEAVKTMKPSIVVFIGHGSINAQGAGQLELVPDDRGQRADLLTGTQLRALLNGIPQVVVMNACETGASSRSSVPLAWEMTDISTPVAIGMTGRVADRACRLFTRRFFEALLSGEDLQTATALARREGMTHGSDPERSVDWAMPALFMADGVTVTADTAAVGLMKDRANRARSFRKITSPLVVCGRAECITAFSAVIGNHSELNVPRTLALRVPEKYIGRYLPRYGKTRVLEELAGCAALAGHVPCFVRRPGGSLLEISHAILVSIFESRKTFGLPRVESQLLNLRKYLESGGGNLSAPVLQELELSPAHTIEEAAPQVLLTAMQADLAALYADTAALAGAIAEPRVIVFIDDLHVSTAAGEMIEKWISNHGLGGPAVAGSPIIPLVFTYSAVDKELYAQNAAAIRNLTEQRPATVQSLDLRGLPPPDDDELPYLQFLLSQKKMFVLPPDDGFKYRKKFFDGLHKRVQGLPSRLDRSAENDDVSDYVDSMAEVDVLITADDEQVIAAKGQG